MYDTLGAFFRARFLDNQEGAKNNERNVFGKLSPAKCFQGRPYLAPALFQQLLLFFFRFFRFFF